MNTHINLKTLFTHKAISLVFAAVLVAITLMIVGCTSNSSLGSLNPSDLKTQAGTFPLTVTSNLPGNWRTYNVGDDAYKPAGSATYSVTPGNYTFDAQLFGHTFQYNVSSTGLVTSSACSTSPAYATCGQGTLVVNGFALIVTSNLPGNWRTYNVGDDAYKPAGSATYSVTPGNYTFDAPTFGTFLYSINTFGLVQAPATFAGQPVTGGTTTLIVGTPPPPPSACPTIGTLSSGTAVWTGCENSNSSNSNNWLNGVLPTSSLIAVFDGAYNTNATIDIPTTIAGLEMNSGYTGTITQGADLTVTGLFTQNAGTFMGGASSLTLSNRLILNGGTFNAPSGLLLFNGQYFGYYAPLTASTSTLQLNSGTFNPNGGTIEFTGIASSHAISLSQPLALNHLIINLGHPNYALSVFDNGNPSNILSVNGDLTMNEGAFVAGTTATIPVAGNIILNNGSLYSGTFTTPNNVTVKSTFDGGQGFLKPIGNVIITAEAGSNSPSIELNTGATMNFLGDAYMNGRLIMNGGTFNAPSGLLTFNAQYFGYYVPITSTNSTLQLSANSNFNPNGGTIEFTGTASLHAISLNQPLAVNNLKINLYHESYPFQVFNNGNPANILTVNADLTMNGGYLSSGDNLVALDDIFLVNGGIGSGSNLITTKNVTVKSTFDGGQGFLKTSGNVIITAEAGSNSPSIELNTGATMNFLGDAYMNGRLVMNGGTFNAPTNGTLTFNAQYLNYYAPATTFNFNGGTFNANGGTIDFAGYASTHSISLNNPLTLDGLKINNSHPSYSFQIFDNGNPNNTLTTNGVLTLSGGYLSGYIHHKGNVSVESTFNGPGSGGVFFDGTTGTQTVIVQAGGKTPILRQGINTKINSLTSEAGSTATFGSDFNMGTLTSNGTADSKVNLISSQTGVQRTLTVDSTNVNSTNTILTTDIVINTTPPLPTNSFSCGDTVTGTVTFVADLNCPTGGPGLIIGSAGATIEGNNFTMTLGEKTSGENLGIVAVNAGSTIINNLTINTTGNNIGVQYLYGINDYNTPMTIDHVTVKNFDRGVHHEYAPVTITNSTVQNNKIGLDVWNLNNSTLNLNDNHFNDNTEANVKITNSFSFTLNATNNDISSSPGVLLSLFYAYPSSPLTISPANFSLGPIIQNSAISLHASPSIFNRPDLTSGVTISGYNGLNALVGSNTSGSNGVWTSSDNVTIENTDISGFDSGVLVWEGHGANGLILVNVNSSNNKYGLNKLGTTQLLDKLQITGSTFSNNSVTGVVLNDTPILSFFHNSISGTSKFTGDRAYTLDNGTEGNHWDRTTDPFFIPGTDTNRADIIDGFPLKKDLLGPITIGAEKFSLGTPTVLPVCAQIADLETTYSVTITVESNIDIDTGTPADPDNNLSKKDVRYTITDGTKTIYVEVWDETTLDCVTQTILLEGFSADFPGPLRNFGTDPDGRIYVADYGSFNFKLFDLVANVRVEKFKGENIHFMEPDQKEQIKSMHILYQNMVQFHEERGEAFPASRVVIRDEVDGKHLDYYDKGIKKAHLLITPEAYDRKPDLRYSYMNVPVYRTQYDEVAEARVEKTQTNAIRIIGAGSPENSFEIEADVLNTVSQEKLRALIHGFYTGNQSQADVFTVLRQNRVYLIGEDLFVEKKEDSVLAKKYRFNPSQFNHLEIRDMIEMLEVAPVDRDSDVIESDVVKVGDTITITGRNSSRDNEVVYAATMTNMPPNMSKVRRQMEFQLMKYPIRSATERYLENREAHTITASSTVEEGRKITMASPDPINLVIETSLLDDIMNLGKYDLSMLEVAKDFWRGDSTVMNELVLRKEIETENFIVEGKKDGVVLHKLRCTECRHTGLYQSGHINNILGGAMSPIFAGTSTVKGVKVGVMDNGIMGIELFENKDFSSPEKLRKVEIDEAYVIKDKKIVPHLEELVKKATLVHPFALYDTQFIKIKPDFDNETVKIETYSDKEGVNHISDDYIEEKFLERLPREKFKEAAETYLDDLGLPLEFRLHGTRHLFYNQVEDTIHVDRFSIRKESKPVDEPNQKIKYVSKKVYDGTSASLDLLPDAKAKEVTVEILPDGSREDEYKGGDGLVYKTYKILPEVMTHTQLKNWDFSYKLAKDFSQMKMVPNEAEQLDVLVQLVGGKPQMDAYNKIGSRTERARIMTLEMEEAYTPDDHKGTNSMFASATLRSTLDALEVVKQPIKNLKSISGSLELMDKDTNKKIFHMDTYATRGRRGWDLGVIEEAAGAAMGGHIDNPENSYVVKPNPEIVDKVLILQERTDPQTGLPVVITTAEIPENIIRDNQGRLAVRIPMKTMKNSGVVEYYTVSEELGEDGKKDLKIIAKAKKTDDIPLSTVRIPNEFDRLMQATGAGTGSPCPCDAAPEALTVSPEITGKTTEYSLDKTGKMVRINTRFGFLPNDPEYGIEMSYDLLKKDKERHLKLATETVFSPIKDGLYDVTGRQAKKMKYSFIGEGVSMALEDEGGNTILDSRITSEVLKGYAVRPLGLMQKRVLETWPHVRPGTRHEVQIEGGKLISRAILGDNSASVTLDDINVSRGEKNAFISNAAKMAGEVPWDLASNKEAKDEGVIPPFTDTTYKRKQSSDGTTSTQNEITAVINGTPKSLITIESAGLEKPDRFLGDLVNKAFSTGSMHQAGILQASGVEGLDIIDHVKIENLISGSYQTKVKDSLEQDIALITYEGLNSSPDKQKIREEIFPKEQDVTREQLFNLEVIKALNEGKIKMLEYEIQEGINAVSGKPEAQIRTKVVIPDQADSVVIGEATALVEELEKDKGEKLKLNDILRATMSGIDVAKEVEEIEIQGVALYKHRFMGVVRDVNKDIVVKVRKGSEAGLKLSTMTIKDDMDNNISLADRPKSKAIRGESISVAVAETISGQPETETYIENGTELGTIVVRQALKLEPTKQSKMHWHYNDDQHWNERDFETFLKVGHAAVQAAANPVVLVDPDYPHGGLIWRAQRKPNEEAGKDVAVIIEDTGRILSEASIPLVDLDHKYGYRGYVAQGMTMGLGEMIKFNRDLTTLPIGTNIRHRLKVQIIGDGQEVEMKTNKVSLSGVETPLRKFSASADLYGLDSTKNLKEKEHRGIFAALRNLGPEEVAFSPVVPFSTKVQRGLDRQMIMLYGGGNRVGDPIQDEYSKAFLDKTGKESLAVWVEAGFNQAKKYPTRPIKMESSYDSSLTKIARQLIGSDFRIIMDEGLIIPTLTSSPFERIMLSQRQVRGLKAMSSPLLNIQEDVTADPKWKQINYKAASPFLGETEIREVIDGPVALSINHSQMNEPGGVEPEALERYLKEASEPKTYDATRQYFNHIRLDATPIAADGSRTMTAEYEKDGVKLLTHTADIIPEKVKEDLIGVHFARNPKAYEQLRLANVVGINTQAKDSVQPIRTGFKDINNVEKMVISDDVYKHNNSVDLVLSTAQQIHPLLAAGVAKMEVEKATIDGIEKVGTDFKAVDERIMLNLKQETAAITQEAEQIRFISNVAKAVSDIIITGANEVTVGKEIINGEPVVQTTFVNLTTNTTVLIVNVSEAVAVTEEEQISVISSILTSTDEIAQVTGDGGTVDIEPSTIEGKATVTVSTETGEVVSTSTGTIENIVNEEPVDTDGDGTPDLSDLCPTTSGMKIAGCPKVVTANTFLNLVDQITKQTSQSRPEVTVKLFRRVPETKPMADYFKNLEGEYNSTANLSRSCAGLGNCPLPLTSEGDYVALAKVTLPDGKFALTATPILRNAFGVEGDASVRLTFNVVRDKYGNYKPTPGNSIMITGSLLYIDEPAYIEIDEVIEYVPFFYNTPDHYWNIVTEFVAPSGCTSDVSKYEDSIDQEMKAAIFTLTCDTSSFAGAQRSDLLAQMNFGQTIKGVVAKAQHTITDCPNGKCKKSQTIKNEIQSIKKKASLRGSAPQGNSVPKKGGKPLSLWRAVKDRLGLSASNPEIATQVIKVASDYSIAIPEWNIDGRLDSRALRASFINSLEW